MDYMLGRHLPESSNSVDDDDRLARRSRGAIVPLGLVAVPPIVFLLGLAVDVYLSDFYSGRQWLINGVGIAMGYGALASLLCGPISLIATIFSFRKMTLGHQVLSLVFLALAMGPLLYMAIYLFALQDLS